MTVLIETEIKNLIVKCIRLFANFESAKVGDLAHLSW